MTFTYLPRNAVQPSQTTAHHLVIDGISWQLFFDDLIAALGHNGTLEPTAQYADFIQWQKEQVDSDQWLKARDHWRQIAQKGRNYVLPNSNAHSKFFEHSGAQFSFSLDESLAQALRTVSLSFGVSPFRVAFGAFISFLYALTRQEGLFVASTVSWDQHLILRIPLAYLHDCSSNKRLIGRQNLHKLIYSLDCR